LGETAEVPGFKLKPAEPLSEGVPQDEEFWNNYRGVQEQLNSTHTETEPVYERGKELHNFFLRSMIVNVIGIFCVPSSGSARAAMTAVTKFP
jgi:hypothetical protein